MNEWVVLGASVIGGAVAAAAALGGVAIGQQAEDARAHNKDRQRLRDRKADRLRVLYEPFVKFSLVLQVIVREKGYTADGETVEERDARHKQAIEEGARNLGEVGAAAIIEPGTEAVRKAFTDTYGASDRYLRSLNTNATSPGTVSLDELNTQFDAIVTNAKKLEDAVVAQMKELEEPI